MTAYRKNGTPHGSSGSGPLYVPGRHNSANVQSTNPAADLKDIMARRPDFNPANPESMFHNVGRKLTATLKIEFLEHLAEWGRIGMAAEHVGVTHSCIIDHRKSDPRFDELCLGAINYHKEQTVATILRQAVEGHPEYKFDREGNLLSVRRMFEPAIRLAILKGYAPEFVETQKQEITHQGGAILVPSPTSDVSNWASVVAGLENGTVPPSVAPVPLALNRGLPDASDGKTTVAGAGEPGTANGQPFEPDSLTYLAASVPTTGWEAVIRRRPKRVDPEETEPPVDGSE
jgi:hypothetical protein